MFLDKKTHIIKQSMLPKCIYRFNAIPITISTGFLSLPRCSVEDQQAKTIQDTPEKEPGEETCLIRHQDLP